MPGVKEILAYKLREIWQALLHSFFNHCLPCSQHYCLCLYHCLHRCTQFWLAACLSKTFHLSRKPATVCLIIHVVVQVVPKTMILASARAAFLTPNKLPSSLESSREHTVSGRLMHAWARHVPVAMPLLAYMSLSLQVYDSHTCPSPLTAWCLLAGGECVVILLRHMHSLTNAHGRSRYILDTNVTKCVAYYS